MAQVLPDADHHETPHAQTEVRGRNGRWRNRLAATRERSHFAEDVVETLAPAPRYQDARSRPGDAMRARTPAKPPLAAERLAQRRDAVAEPAVAWAEDRLAAVTPQRRSEARPAEPRGPVKSLAHAAAKPATTPVETLGALPATRGIQPKRSPRPSSPQERPCPAPLFPPAS